MARLMVRAALASAAVLVAGVGSSALAVTLQPDGSPTPGDANLRLWLDASDSGTLFQDTAGVSPIQFSGQPVARWEDKSGNNLHVTEGSANRPDYVGSSPSLNGRPALYFDGDVLQRANDTGVSGNADRTVITVWSDAVDYDANYQHSLHMGSTSANQAYGISVYRGGGNARIGNHYWGGGFDTTRNGSSAARMAMAMWDGDGGTAGNGLDRWYVDGLDAGASDRAPLDTGTSQLTIGSRLAPPTEGIRGNIAEVIVFDQVLNWEEQQAIGGYLTGKYGLTARYGPQTMRFSTIADFDITGPARTGYTKRPSGYTPTVQETGGPTGNFMRIAQGIQGNTNPGIAFDQTADLSDSVFFKGEPSVLIDFDFRFTPGNGQADGMGLALLRTEDYGESGAGPAFSEEPNLTSAGGANFGVGLDIHQGGESNNNHASLHFGSLLTTANPGFDFSDGNFHHASIALDYAPGGAYVTMTLQQDSLGMTGLTGTPVTVFDRYFVPGLDPYAYRMALSARTGGQTADHDIDNVNVKSGLSAFSFASDFRGRESELNLVGSAAFADVGNMQRLRITPAAGSQEGSAWHVEKQPVASGFLTDFQFQFSEGSGGGADGLSFIVQNTAAGPSLSVGEGGPDSDALTIAFDSYQNGGEPSAASIAIRAGGGDLFRYNLAQDPMSISDLSDSGVHDVRIEYLMGKLDVYFDGLLLIDDVAVDLRSLGAVDPFGLAWVGFGARTGGAWENHDVLNWHFATLSVPEPSTWVLLGLGGVGLLIAARRRRRGENSSRAE